MYIDKLGNVFTIYNFIFVIKWCVNTFKIVLKLATKQPRFSCCGQYFHLSRFKFPKIQNPFSSLIWILYLRNKNLNVKLPVMIINYVIIWPCYNYQLQFLNVYWQNFLLSHAVVNKPSAKVCEMDVNEENFQSLKYAVDNHYWYQMYIGMFGDYCTVLSICFLQL